MNVTAVLVTRGDVSLEAVRASLPFENVIVYDNSVQPDLAVYGRYQGLLEAPDDVIYVQDDDCLLPPESIAALVAAYEPGMLVANMPERFRQHYPDSCLVGFGAIFDKDLPTKAFIRYFAHEKRDIPTFQVNGNHAPSFYVPATFLRTCDVVFSTLTPRKLLDVPHEDLPWASDANRMWKQSAHYGERQEMLKLARSIRDS
jgi:hypothetical protein